MRAEDFPLKSMFKMTVRVSFISGSKSPQPLKNNNGYNISVKWDLSLANSDIMGSADWETGRIYLNPDNRLDSDAKFNDDKHPIVFSINYYYKYHYTF